MKITKPKLTGRMETGLALKEVLSLAAAYEDPVEGYSFADDSAQEMQLEKAEIRRCCFRGCVFTGSVFSGAWLHDAVFEGCDFSGAVFADASFQRVELNGCKLSGTNFSAALLEDTVMKNCIGKGAVFSEARMKGTAFIGCEFAGASFGAIKQKSRFRFEDCGLEQADFLHTSLSGQDLTDCRITGAYFSGREELAGAKVTMLQACELARLLGVQIE